MLCIDMFVFWTIQTATGQLDTNPIFNLQMFEAIYVDIYTYIYIYRDIDIDIHIIAKASFDAKCELSIKETLRLRLMPNLIALRLDVAGTPHEILLRSPETCGGNEMATTSMEISWILKT